MKQHTSPGTARISPADADEVLRRTLRTLARNRVPGYNFPGNFMDLQCRRFDTGGVSFEMAAGPHCTNAQGIVHPSAVSMFADMVLAAAIRAYVDPFSRTATLLLRYEFTGAPARGSLIAQARSEGFSTRTALPQGLATGGVYAGGVEIIRASGTWVSPPTPPGRHLAPLPWESKEPIRYPEVSRADLEPAEEDVMRRVERALRAGGKEGLLHHLWSPTVRATRGGALSRIPLGLHLGNRVGHVQGGLTMHVALATAVAAVPHHPLLTGASAWFISPGRGNALTTRATVLQHGNNVAVVRTEVFAPGRKLVLEVISNHGIPARHPA